MIRKLCAAGGCSDLAEPGEPHCEYHAKRAAERRAEARAEAQRGKDAARNRRLYQDPAWKKAARLFLRKHPLCAECESVGLVEPATDVDHIEPHRGDRALFWRRSNWQPLCHPCHSRKTAREVWHSKGGGPKN